MDVSSLSSIQDQFEEMLGHIQRILNYRFRYMDPESRREAVQEGTGLAWRNFTMPGRRGSHWEPRRWLTTPPWM